MFRNLNSKKQIILLIIPNGKTYHYIAIKNVSALSRRITSKNNGEFCCLKKECENKFFCRVVMSSKDNKILAFNHYQKFDKIPPII